MPNPDDRRFPATLSLQRLSTFNSDKEKELGPLIRMGNDGVDTVLTYDTDGDTPTNPVVFVADCQAKPAGSLVVCSGVIFISGVQTPSTGTRGG